ncbi:hypothetical protein GCM10017655_38330 [Pseudomonas turukhanskensis]|uniref:Uncharacterized protein n=1 Tax=Pseudomonas turukhanskensis TaxID=1806536 RepID=A0A9W6KB23_9PSED|nr:hypothetical protein GCM10017655_38330 [Pseudomonas turukhanskensis]
MPASLARDGGPNNDRFKWVFQVARIVITKNLTRLSSRYIRRYCQGGQWKGQLLWGKHPSKLRLHITQVVDPHRDDGQPLDQV